MLHHALERAELFTKQGLTFTELPLSEGDTSALQANFSGPVKKFLIHCASELPIHVVAALIVEIGMAATLPHPPIVLELPNGHSVKLDAKTLEHPVKLEEVIMAGQD